MEKKTKIKRNKLSIARQYICLKQKYKNLILFSYLHKSMYEIVLKIKPLKDFNEYKIKITQKHNESPKVYVLEPNIYKMTNGKKPPHVYVFDEYTCQICLFMKYELDLTTVIDSFVPWISEWLLHFEIWCITGTWKGGGHTINEKCIK